MNDESYDDKIRALESRLFEVEQDFKNSQRARSYWLINVYDKFKDIESRQLEIETLLKSERVKELISMIPTENDIERLILRIEKTEIGRLNKCMEDIRDVLEDLNSAFL